MLLASGLLLGTTFASILIVSPNLLISSPSCDQLLAILIVCFGPHLGLSVKRIEPAGTRALSPTSRLLLRLSVPPQAPDDFFATRVYLLVLHDALLRRECPLHGLSFSGRFTSPHALGAAYTRRARLNGDRRDIDRPGYGTSSIVLDASWPKEQEVLKITRLFD